MNEKYEEVRFEAKYQNEDQDQRYKRLLREFDSKFADSLVNLHGAVKDKARDDSNINIKDLKQALTKYEEQVNGLRNNIVRLKIGMEKIPYIDLRTKRSKQASESDALVVDGYPTQKYLIEVLARSITAIDKPDDAENKIHLLNLANEIPEDTQGYWPHVKLGIIFFVTEAAALGIILGGVGIAASLAAPPVAALALVLLALIPTFAGAYIMAQEASDLSQTNKAQGIKHAITSSQGTLFHPKANALTETDNRDDRPDMSPDGSN